MNMDVSTSVYCKQTLIGEHFKNQYCLDVTFLSSNVPWKGSCPVTQDGPVGWEIGVTGFSSLLLFLSLN